MIRSAKQITFLYFSIVAFAISAIHISVFESTTEDLEQLYAQNRLDKIYQLTLQLLEDGTFKPVPKLEPFSQDFDGEPPSIIYFDPSLLSHDIQVPGDIEYDIALEVNDYLNEGNAHNYFVMRKSYSAGKDMWIVIENSVYELSEEQLLNSQTKQFLISFSLLLLSLYVVLKISERLTAPMSAFANTLATRSPDELDPVAVPPGSASRELVQMVTSFNDFQERIKALMAKERAFNRYASHELRSPLTVINGALTLLGATDDQAFIEKQRLRMQKAAKEMQEFIETLLDLSKNELSEELSARAIDAASIEEVIKSHEHLIEHKDIRWQVHIDEPAEIKMPDPVFQILFGNLIKNAFAYTKTGTVEVRVNSKEIQVIDSGVGLQHDDTLEQGYGLGLLMVRDICNRYGLNFKLSQHQQGGCIASLKLRPED